MEYEPRILRIFLFSLVMKVMVAVVAFGFGVVVLTPEVSASYYQNKQEREKLENKQEKRKEDPRITEAELQSQVMGFSDRFAVIISQSFEDFKTNAPSPKAQLTAHDDLAYFMASAFTIAAEPNPEVALLDMTALVTLGRMVYEEHWLVQWETPRLCRGTHKV